MRLRDADVETRSAAKYLSTDVPINKVDGPQTWICDGDADGDGDKHGYCLVAATVF